MKKLTSILFMLALFNTSPLIAYKLISLNIWGGHIREPLIDFIKTHQDIDFFCFQEVYHNAPHKISTDDKEVTLNIFSELQQQLPNHHGYFLPIVKGIYGIAMFAHKDIEVLSHGETRIHENQNYMGKGPTHRRSLQWIKCSHNGNKFYVLNVHGLWNGKGKADSEERINQSKKIREFIQSLNYPIVLCGDFNLTPNTQSMKIIEQGMKNMITLHNILSTRTSFYSKKERFADYIIVSPELTINSFKVLPNEVSDHSPLFLDFDLSLPIENEML